MSNLSKDLRPRSWRTQETHDQYLHDRQVDIKTDRCPLCTAETLVQYTYWRIIPNKYPHDAVADKHEMIIPIGHTLERELSPEAKQELYNLKYNVLGKQYVFILEALPGQKSIPGHFHLHLMNPKVIG